LSLSECLDEKRKKVSLGQFYKTFFYLTDAPDK
jgi:hypothetical protein